MSQKVFSNGKTINDIADYFCITELVTGLLLIVMFSFLGLKNFPKAIYVAIKV